MTILLATTFPRSLDDLVARHADAPEGTTVEAWLFEDRASRRAAEERLAAVGVKARLRSAYKPLLHFFLEDVADLASLQDVHVAYPHDGAAPDNRFLLEAYPLGGLFGEDTVLAFAPSGHADLTYRVTLIHRDGTRTDHRVFAPNRHHRDAIGETHLSPTGWLIDGGHGHGERLRTDYEMVFEATVEAVAGHDWGETEPYFEELTLAATIPARDERIPFGQDGFGEEAVSLAEALHEDLYFSLLEVFQKRSGRPLGDRGLRPGQIVPDIRIAAGPPTLRIEVRPLAAADTDMPRQVLDRAAAPLGAAQIREELAKVGGKPFTAGTRAGRTVEARYVQGTDRAVMISAGQHANETTGPVGALRAGLTLSARKGAHFTLSPLENPDGSEIHRRLCASNPTHMHHAARYTAFGDDLEYRTGTDLHEKAIRLEAEGWSGASLHVNLHGYPSHEWTRPLSGYLPRGFALWTVPKGFFLILRHAPGWAEASEALLDRVTKRLAALPGLLAFNAAQIRLFELHAGATGFRIVNGFPCLVGEDDRHRVPVTLITEYPDETIYGEAFRAGHEAQKETVLAAYDAWQEIALPDDPVA